MSTSPFFTGDSLSRRGGTIPGTGKAAFTLTVPDGVPLPVLVAIPHAGRSYPDALVARMRRPDYAMPRLEDRLVDRIGSVAARATGAALLVAHAPRAMVDLNRSNEDVDWSMVRDGARPVTSTLVNRRARSGLGLVPRRLPVLGEIWKGPIAQPDLDARIGQIHEPYHAALEKTLKRIREVWGAALLVDVHSMPPLRPKHIGDRPAECVIGDRFGRAASGRIVAETLRKLAATGMGVAHNRPYAGGYVLDRHAAPEKGIHAIQIELCRTTYLDAELAELGPGAGRVEALLTELLRHLAGVVAQLGTGRGLVQAAE